MTTAANPPVAQPHEFKAEIKQLLDILIHSVYTSKDVFLRELISNSTDAIEKVRFLQASGQPVVDADLPLEIKLETRTEAAAEGAPAGERKVLAIVDTGIGMTEAEVHANIGTIAHSGATAFLQQLAAEGKEAAQKDVSLIGRFGVGFYSVFMVAERIVLTTRSAKPDEPAIVWTSDGMGSYVVEPAVGEVPRGTRIEIHLKPSEDRFADEHTLQETIRRYSNFVPFPILVNGEQTNQTSALWREPASQVKDEQYNEFFKLISHDDEDPLLRLHFSVDAPLQYSALLFVPRSNHETLGFGRTEVSLQLYVKRVLIDSENKNLLPNYLRFVRGVVESDDLPLNVSRETLQENRLVGKIRDTLTGRLLDKLLELAEKQPEEYRQFWEKFGRIFKEGYSDFAYRQKFQDLLRFNSSRHDDDKGLIGLKDYAAAMPAEQKAIYYLSGPSRAALLRDPRLELFRKRGIEVLYLQEMADEFVIGSAGNYDGKQLISADQVKADDLKGLGKDEAADKPEDIAKRADIGLLSARFKEILGPRVTDVRTSERLVDSPACLVSDDRQPSGHIDKLMRMMNKSSDLPQRVMELNPSHPLIKSLTELVAKDGRDPFVERAAEQLFEGAMLVDGYLTDPHKLVERMNQILEDAAKLKNGPG
ncbi:MAG: molecular chaperone HtpG [Planctomycetia bacterium]|nr:molecular chaperone HtpG [Planctomycetia bacterium]